MKKGKIILSAAALVITAAGAISFKVASKFNNRHTLLGSYVSAGQTLCAKVTCWTVASGGSGTTGKCHTNVSKLQTVRKTYTSKTANQVKCQNLWQATKTHVK